MSFVLNSNYYRQFIGGMLCLFVLISLAFNDYIVALYWPIIIVSPFLILLCNYFLNGRVIKANKDTRLIFSLFMVFCFLIAFTGLFSTDVYNPLKLFIRVFFSCLLGFLISRLSMLSESSKVLKVSFRVLIIILSLVVLLGFNPDKALFEYQDSAIGKNSASLILYFSIAILMVLSIDSEKKINLNLFDLFFYFIVVAVIVLTISFKTLIALFSPTVYILFLVFRYNFYLFLIVLTVFVFAIYRLIYGYSDTLGYNIVLSKFSSLFGLDIESSFESNAIAGREFLISEALSIFYNNPLFGVGLENTRLYMGTYSHNTWIEILSGMGVIGFLPFSFAFIVLIKIILNSCFSIGNKIYIFSLLLGVFIISNGQSVYATPFFYIFIFIVLYKCHNVKLYKVRSRSS